MERWNEHPRGALHAYFDGELSLEGSLAVEEHLAACQLCRREQVTLGALHWALLAKGRSPEPVPAPGRLRGVVRPGRRIVALGGATALAAVLIAAMLGPGRAMHIRGEVTQVHAPTVIKGRSVDLASDDPAAIERWLAARLPESIALAGGGQGFALYGLRGHVAGVSAWRSPEPDSEPQPAIVGPWTVCRWAHLGVAYWMVSSAGVEDLRALALLIRSRPI
jgi:anti-sigma factor RsiW